MKYEKNGLPKIWEGGFGYYVSTPSANSNFSTTMKLLKGRWHPDKKHWSFARGKLRQVLDACMRDFGGANEYRGNYRGVLSVDSPHFAGLYLTVAAPQELVDAAHSILRKKHEGDEIVLDLLDNHKLIVYKLRGWK